MADQNKKEDTSFVDVLIVDMEIIPEGEVIYSAPSSSCHQKAVSNAYRNNYDTNFRRKTEDEALN